MPMVGGISGLDIHGNSWGTNFNEPSNTYSLTGDTETVVGLIASTLAPVWFVVPWSTAVKKRNLDVTASPVLRSTAYYWIQANVLKAEKMDLRDAQGFLKTGYEGAAMGAALGAGITAYNSSSAGATLGVGAGHRADCMAADAMVEDVNYTIGDRSANLPRRSKAAVTTDNIAALKQGTRQVLSCRPARSRATVLNTRLAWYPTPTRVRQCFCQLPVITLPRMTAPGAALSAASVASLISRSSSIKMHQIYERADYSAEFWSLIHLERRADGSEGLDVMYWFTS
ncbi:hypothetical protein L1887_43537 [Cichorium endivia]|nr:hypothetical protein L1887_43537 [Cichorium endivia]